MGEEGPATSGDPETRKRAREEGDLKRVAEIVMVLSAMGQMRGGKEPTAAEKALVAEARERLVMICEAIRPKELFSTEAVRVVADDLGLSRSKDPGLGFRPPKMSIAEKLLLTKKKMDESKETSVHSTVLSPQQFPLGFGVKSDSCGTLAHDAGGFHSPISRVPVLACAASPLKQLHVSNVQSGVNKIKHSSGPLDKGWPSAHTGLNVRSSGPSYVTQDQVENLPKKSSTISSMQSSSVAAVARFGQPTKWLDHSSIKSEGASGVNAVQASHQMKNQDIKSSVIQAGQGGLHIPHQPPQGVAFIHTPALYTNHNDIATSVQKILQPKVPDHPSWTPPSSEYMNAPLNCQICNNVIADIESLLVCDACEKGNHLKCLQSYGSRAVSKAEWHCPNCLASSNGKPLPPKYGKVTRAPVPAQKVAPNSAASKKTEDSGPKVSQLKAIANGNSGVSQNSSSANEGISAREAIPDSAAIDIEMNLITTRVKGVIEKSNALGGNHLKETTGAACANSDMPCENHNNLESDSSVSANTKESPNVRPRTLDENNSMDSQSLVVENNHFNKATVAQNSDQDLSSNVKVSTSHLHENTTTITSGLEVHGEKKPSVCIEVSSVRVVNEGSLEATPDESNGSFS
ncbi:uncharacterized protein LOC122034644 [Zingiber officinale]|uniref:PHD-type domain-containing protein n=1 Tax=Zingiber officinale TaxID=94328 RepID=A0A8J5EPW5_ZINOF|nr:uncharacterized protein LOC122034644 [Zingiber officinale]XP_042449897.1 uncharacterized protein LOC122034644 [Zingiber officinale]KAG6469516.1 hypothetical protein ZIOFF_074240 [Zingiber officinale]